MRVKESHRDWLSIPAVAATLTLCSISVASSAHHAFAAEFDADKPFIVKGEVTRVKWVNPHSWLYFDVKSADGTLTNWGVEFGTPVQLASKGLTRTDLPIGSIVSVKGYRSKNGEPTGYSVTLTLADGRSFQTGAAQDVPSEPTKTASLVK